MATITLELPDDILEAVRIEAEYFGTAAKERLERMVEDTHRHRDKHPRADMGVALERVLEPGEARPLREYLPAGKTAWQ